MNELDRLDFFFETGISFSSLAEQEVMSQLVEQSS